MLINLLQEIKMKEDLKIAELLCARYSHDLAGPIGAINNGVEFLDTDDMSIKEKALDLLMSSSKQAVRRLQFFRQVFGFIAPGMNSSVADLISVSKSYFEDTKLHFDCTIDESANNNSFTSRFIKLIFNGILITSSAAIAKGEIRLHFKTDSEVVIDIRADRINLDDYIRNVLIGKMKLVELNTKNIHVYYFCRLVEELKAKLELDVSEKHVRMQLNL